LYRLFGIRSRLGVLRLALGIIPVRTAETEPTGQAGPSKPANPFADPLMASFIGEAVVKLVVASKDDGESDGSMSEGEIRLAASAMTDLVKACGHSVRHNFELADNLSDSPKYNRKHWFLGDKASQQRSDRTRNPEPQAATAARVILVIFLSSACSCRQAGMHQAAVRAR
jgi:hypothetical protein